MIFLSYLSLHFTLRSTIRFKGAPKHVQKFEAKFYACNNLLCKINVFLADFVYVCVLTRISYLCFYCYHIT